MDPVKKVGSTGTSSAADGLSLIAELNSIIALTAHVIANTIAATTNAPIIVLAPVLAVHIPRATNERHQSFATIREAYYTSHKS